MPDSAFRRRIAPYSTIEISFTDVEGEFRKRYRLAFNLNVLAEISEKTGRESLDLALWAQFDAVTLRAMLWAALLPYHPQFDTKDQKGQRTNEGLETVGSWLTAENQPAVTQALTDAYLLYLPKDQAERLRDIIAGKDPQGEGEGPLGKKIVEPGTDGLSSGPSADTTSESQKAKSAS